MSEYGPLFDLGLHPGPIALWVYRSTGVEETREEAAERFKVSVSTVRRWERDLFSAGMMSDDGELIKEGIPVRHKDGKRARCTACGVLNPAGAWCPRCKQRFRSDRSWHNEAIAVARLHLETHGSVKPSSVAAAVQKPLRDFTTGNNAQPVAGVLRVLAKAGLIDEAEVRRVHAVAKRGW